MKTIILARVSTEEQKNEGLSIPAQIRCARKYAKRKGLVVDSEYQFDESSSKDKRKKFEDVITHIKKAKGEIALVVETVDRLQRSFKESVMLDEFRKSGKLTLHFIRENLIIHQDSNSSEIQRWDLAVFVAKSYILQLSDNVKRSFREKIKNGEWIGFAPVGYKHTEEGIVIDDDKKFYVRRAFELYASRQYSMWQITQLLKKEGLISNYRTHKPLSKSQVHSLLHNPFYYGQMRIKGKLYPHKHGAIIDKWLFDKCQEISSGRRHEKTRTTTKPFVFKGILKCDYCGRNICSDIKKGKYIYLFCTKYKTNCQNTRIREEVVTEQIQEVFKKAELPDFVLKDIESQLRTKYKDSNKHNNLYLDSLQKEDKLLSKKIENVMDEKFSQSSKSITNDEYDKMIEKYKNQQIKLNEQIKDMTISDEEFRHNFSYLLRLTNRIYKLFKSSKPDKKRKLIEFPFSNLKLKDGLLGFNLKPPFNLIFSINQCSNWLRGSGSNRQP